MPCVDVLDKVIKLCVVDAKIIDICIEGDKAITEATNAIYNKKGKNKITKGKQILCGFGFCCCILKFWEIFKKKGIGFPTTVSVNNCVAHFTPIPSDPEAAATLKEGDVAKM